MNDRKKPSQLFEITTLAQPVDPEEVKRRLERAQGLLNPAIDWRKHAPLFDHTRHERHYEQRRIRLAEEEGEAKAEGEFRRRQELEAEQREQQAQAAPVQQPAPARESIEERNDRWLNEERRYRRENKASRMAFCRHIEETEGVKTEAVKKALRKAEEKLAEKYREGGATPLPSRKHTANDPFNQAKQLKSRKP